MKYLATVLLALAATARAASTDNPSDAFYAAIRANDLSRLRAMLPRRASANVQDARGLTPLMYAAAAGSADAMKLLLDKGADPNVQNAFGSTALMWSVTDIKKVRLLIERGADVKAASKRGRTALLLAAMSDHSADIVRLLMAKGADAKAVDIWKLTTLAGATGGNDTGTVRLLADAGVDVNATATLEGDTTLRGGTPLLNAAANGNLEVVKLLLAKGADVNTSSGPAEVVKALLDAGADVNAREVRGMTPLMLAVATDRQNPEIIRLLLDKGADLETKSLLGETVLDWARKIGPPSTVEALRRAGALETAAPAVAVAVPAPVDLRPAVERGVALLEKSSAEFFVNGGCVSCHAQNMTDLAVGVARTKGMRVDEKAAAARRKAVQAFYEPAGPMFLERMDAPVVDILSFSLAGLAATGYAPDRMTDAMVANIASQQWHDGCWHSGGVARPPSQEGDIFRTALGIRVLKVYGPPGRGAEMKQRIERAKEWLLAATPATADDRNMQLLGLHWAGADSPVLQRLAREILTKQRPDGGWAQRSEIESDAYATGQSLFALAEAGGIAPRHAAYQKGVKYLLSTQRADGSWYVRSRSPKFQPYFEGGFPYGHDQWISSAATSWATMALTLALEATPAKLAAAD